MKPEPLKINELHNVDKFLTELGYPEEQIEFDFQDIEDIVFEILKRHKSAVEWLKEKISHDGFSYELIDEAFEDVTKEASEKNEIIKKTS